MTATAASGYGGYGLEDASFLVSDVREQARRRARRAVAERAQTTAECRELLDMLGLLEES